MPSVVGQTVDAANQALTEAGFQVQTGTPEYSELPVNTVIRQDPSGSATPGSIITLILSQGPDPASQQPGNSNNQGQQGQGENQGQGNGGGNDR
ncbi:hypothetical protein Cde04nite_00110 [Cellulomonas denverensis]|nr:hypothetical protein Cde04nite_00110 [Cellulomonas denverensis]